MYFRFRKKSYGEELKRECSVGGRARIQFETDADNDYFSRDAEPGDFALYAIEEGERRPVTDYCLNLLNGTATLSILVPAGNGVSETIRYVAVVTDPSRVDPFENRVTLTLTLTKPTQGQGGKKRQKRPRTKEDGDDSDTTSQIAMPEITRVREAQWEEYTPPFDKETALRIQHAGAQPAANGQSHEVDVYDFYVNMDNVHLKRFAKYEAPANQDDRVPETQFETALVLVGLAMIHGELTAANATSNDQTDDESGDNGRNIEDEVERVTRSLAPFILPMIASLGSLDEESVSADSASGEAV